MSTPPAKRARLAITASLKKKNCQRKVEHRLSSLRFVMRMELNYRFNTVIVMYMYMCCLEECSAWFPLEKHTLNNVFNNILFC